MQSMGIYVEEIMGYKQLYVSVPVERQKDGKLVMVDKFWKNYDVEIMNQFIESLEELKFEK